MNSISPDKSSTVFIYCIRLNNDIFVNLPDKIFSEAPAFFLHIHSRSSIKKKIISADVMYFLFIVKNTYPNMHCMIYTEIK